MTIAEPVATPPSRDIRWPGRTALALGILTPIAVVAGVVAVSYDAFGFATIAAWTGIAASALAGVISRYEDRVGLVRFMMTPLCSGGAMTKCSSARRG